MDDALEILKDLNDSFSSLCLRREREHGRIEGMTEAIMVILEHRGFVVPDGVREKLQAAEDMSEMIPSLQRALTAASLDDIFSLWPEPNKPLERARDVLIVLRARGMVVTGAMEQQILSCKDQKLLQRWLVRAATIPQTDDLFLG